jgi:hypothetical protein
MLACQDWKAASRNSRSLEHYTSGPARLVEVFDGTKPAVALLLSHEFAESEWMVNCVEAGRETGFARFDIEDQMEPLQREQLELRVQLQRCQKDMGVNIKTTGALASRIGNSARRKNLERLDTEELRIGTRLLELQDKVDLLEDTFQQAQHAWQSFQHNISVIHDEVLVKAKVFPPGYVEDQEETEDEGNDKDKPEESTCRSTAES